MRSPASTTLLALVTVLGLAGPVGAQSVAPAARPLPATDSLFKRARRLVSEGDGAAGRAIVDSLLRAAAEGTPAYGDALYWRGALAETAADAERDYRRVIVEYALSAYADEALLSLAELEQARGDRSAAYQHLQRFVREHPMGPARARAGLAAARLAFEQRDVTRGCAMIADARQSVGGDVELRNQIEYHGARCPTSSASASAASAPPVVRSTGAPSGAPTPAPSASTSGAASSRTTATPASGASVVAAPRGDTTTRSAAAASETVRSSAPAPAPASAPTTRPAATETAPRGIWTIQLAAYNTRPDAEALVRKLAARGVKARISGDAKPFRVRLDYYQTRQEAVARVAELKQRGIIGFVTDEPRAAGAARP